MKKSNKEPGCYYCQQPIEHLSDGYMIDGSQLAFIHKACHHKKGRVNTIKMVVMVIIVAVLTIHVFYTLGVPLK